MRHIVRLSVFVLAFAAFLCPSSSRAAYVSISHQKLAECGRGFVFCNGHQAYSLSEIESGALQIPVFPILPSEVVIVNDTGETVTNLQFTLTTLQILSFDVQCQIASTALQFFNGCAVAKSSTGFSFDPLRPVSAQFTFSANNDEGVPNGEYFDITTAGFLPGGYLCGGTGSGTGGSGGSGGSGGTGGSGGSGGSSGPPSQ